MRACKQVKNHAGPSPPSWEARDHLSIIRPMLVKKMPATTTATTTSSKLQKCTQASLSHRLASTAIQAHASASETDARRRTAEGRGEVRDALHISRRTVLAAAPLVGNAGVTQTPRRAALADTTPPDERSAVLSAIARGEDPAKVEALIDRLVATGDPSQGTSASTVDGTLAGEWILLWASGAAEPQKIQAALGPIAPTSSQLIGAPAASLAQREKVGACQVLTFLGGGVRVVLAAGAVPTPSGAKDTLEIQPPFSLDLLVGGRKLAGAEFASDADFRTNGVTPLNKRDDEAIAAPRNQYTQLFVENSGQPGDVRVSRVTAGDPVVVGTTYVHVRV